MVDQFVAAMMLYDAVNRAYLGYTCSVPCVPPLFPALLRHDLRMLPRLSVSNSQDSQVGLSNRLSASQEVSDWQTVVLAHVVGPNANLYNYLCRSGNSPSERLD